MFFICLFVWNCNSNDAPPIENKCNVLSETITSEDFPEISNSNYLISEVEINEDGIHPNKNGYLIMEPILEKAIKKYMN